MPEKPRPNKRAILGNFVIASIAYIVLGVFMVIKSQAVANGINDVFGVIMLIYGVINIIVFFINKDADENLFLELATGVIAIGLGVFSLVAQDLMQQILFYAIGGVLLIDALVNIKRAVNLRYLGFPRWNIFLIAAIIGVLLGILCIVFYTVIPQSVVVFFGVSLIYEGVSSLIILILDARVRKRISNDLARIERDHPQIFLSVGRCDGVRLRSVRRDRTGSSRRAGKHRRFLWSPRKNRGRRDFALLDMEL